jgi:NADH-quinone oxidoreductase subunit A
MGQNYLPVLVFFGGGMLFIAAGLGLSWLLQTRKPNPEKLSFYECGEETVRGESRFNLRFFLAALVFLLMEVELVLMAPVMLNRSGIQGIPTRNSSEMLKVAMLVFLLILGLGFLIALGLRFFDWQKPQAHVESFQGAVPDFVYEQYNLDCEKLENQGR